MIYTGIPSTIDLAQGVELTHLRHPLVQDDSRAHVITVAVVRNGVAVDLSGAAITGSFVRADGITVPLTGETSNNTASVTLPPECYREEGRCVMAVKVTHGDTISTLFLAEGVVTRAATSAFVADDETSLSLEELFRRLDAGVASVEASAEVAAQAAEDAQVALGGAEAVARAEAAAEAAEAALARLEGIDVSTLVQEIDTLRAATTPTLLWSAADESGWTSGDITVEGIGDWFLVAVQTGLGMVLGLNTGSQIRASGVLGSASSHQSVNVNIGIDGTTLTLNSSTRLIHTASADHGAVNTTPVRSITGLMKKGISTIEEVY